MSLVLAYVSMLAKARLSYRADFFVQVGSDLLLQAVDIAFLAVVFTRVKSLAGWSFAEALFIYGFFLIPFALFNASFAALSDVGARYVVGGELDRVLTRPLNALVQVQLELLRPQALNGVVLGVIVMAIASSGLGLTWTAADVTLVLAGILGAWLVYGGLWIAVASLTFWTQERGSGLFPVFYNTINFSRYPLSVYPAAVRFMLTFVLPYGFIAFYPAAGVLREEFTRVGWFTLPVGLVVMAVGVAVWQRGLARYEGAGS
ncbi:ABC transporter permease [Deinococcus malanensis]|uniref:ABC transporter permease n=1 Tax=Deinococcus malanensis TaxID=1706855 RepID=UPI0016676433|nr:ABC-2 family transporter protein [Deinococcus malanensis]